MISLAAVPETGSRGRSVGAAPCRRSEPKLRLSLSQVTSRRIIKTAFCRWNNIEHIVWSSKLRALGLKGFGGEDGIMAYALNTHFQCSGPEGWHFVAKCATQKTMATVQRCNEVRLLSKPHWLHTYLFHLIATERIHLCKPLARPDAALPASCRRQLKPHVYCVFC